MNINDIATQLLYTTTIVACTKADGTKSQGTGFFFSYKMSSEESVPFLITNQHVIDGAIKVYADMIEAKSGNPTRNALRIEFDGEYVRQFILGVLDLVAIPIAPALNALEKTGNPVFYRTIDQDIIPNQEALNELSAIEELTFVGYPAGIGDSYNKTPVFRSGISATPLWNDYNGSATFLIDGGVYPGSSGSPVFILNRGSYPTSDGIAIGSRLLFVGVITKTKIELQSSAYLDLGEAIASYAIVDELKSLVERLLPSQS